LCRAGLVPKGEEDGGRVLARWGGMHILPPMSALRQPLQLFTAEDYLRRERTASFKSEYVNGHVYAMAGASINHNRISANVLSGLRTRLRSRPCEVLGSDMKVRVDKANVFRYPDVSGLCGPILFHDKTQDAHCNPSFIVEVMAPSTELLDRGEKFTLYRLLDSLREYMLVWQDRLRVELFVRNEEGGVELDYIR
jgi:Uma2 family endonuclease